MADNAKNFAKATVSTTYDAVATSVVLTAGHGAKLPTAPFNAVWWDSTTYPDPSDDPNVEIVRVTAVSTDTLTVTRAQEGTTASTKNTAGKTYKMIAGLTAGTVNNGLLGTKGADIASASTTDIASASGEYINVTGTTTITAFGTATAGIERVVNFTGILTLTHNATSLILPTSANITTAVGDVAIFRSLGSGNWKCVSYMRANGQPLTSAGSSFIGCKVTHSYSVNIRSDFVVVMPWDTETHDTDTMHDTSTNKSRITIKTAGYYVFDACVPSNVSGSGYYMRGKLVKNGTTIITTASSSDNGYSSTWNVVNLHCPATYYNVNDYVEVFVQDTSGSGSVDTAKAYYFSAEKVG